MSPERIQRKRTAGWRTPLCSCGCGEEARYVGRPSKWGNPYLVSPGLTAQGAVWRYRDLIEFSARGVVMAELRGVEPWTDRDILTTIRRELGGHDLVCWCPLDSPCHADVLLELANAEAVR
jgi:hypothetical protein